MWRKGDLDGRHRVAVVIHDSALNPAIARDGSGRWLQDRPLVRSLTLAQLQRYDVARLLMMLTSMTRGRLAIEVGALAGYSGIWLARGLQPGGRLITIEFEPKHAEFAREQFEKAGVADRVEVRVGKALDVLPRLARDLAPASVDVVFLDAEKTEYPDYWRIVRPLIAVGGLILADNVLGSGDWWIDAEGNESRDAADRFSRLVANDRDLESVAVPLRQGVLIGRRVR